MKLKEAFWDMIAAPVWGCGWLAGALLAGVLWLAAAIIAGYQRGRRLLL